MRFALVNDERCEAKKGLSGICPICSQSLIAKCGNHKIHHWSHRSSKVCDSWWEQETEWHRQWKDNFPKECQEIILHDEQTNEKHIADIRTTDEIVIEFQHSHITPQERASREKFYKNMIWVVDGTRLIRDYPRFQKAFTDRNITQTCRTGFFYIASPDECLSRDWVNSSVPVVFDFRGTTQIADPRDIRNCLWCFLPSRKDVNVSYSPGYKITKYFRDMLIAINQDDFVVNHKQLLQWASEPGSNPGQTHERYF